MIRRKRTFQIPSELLASGNEAVFLLHGFAGTPWLMRRLETYLERANYRIENWGYPSTRKSIVSLADDLRRRVAHAIDDLGVTRVHFVTHSMGSIVVRQAFGADHPPEIGRIVMLAPPNSGSHFARAGAVVLGKFVPALRELSTSKNSHVNRLTQPKQLEIGVIAASNDWVVRRRSTHLATQRDHIVVKGNHVRLPLMRGAAEQTLRFLSTGAFSHTDAKRRFGPGRTNTIASL